MLYSFRFFVKLIVPLVAPVVVRLVPMDSLVVPRLLLNLLSVELQASVIPYPANVVALAAFPLKSL